MKELNLTLFVFNVLALVANLFFLYFGAWPTANFIGCVFSVLGALTSWLGYQTHKAS